MTLIDKITHVGLILPSGDMASTVAEITPQQQWVALTVIRPGPFGVAHFNSDKEIVAVVRMDMLRLAAEGDMVVLSRGGDGD